MIILDEKLSNQIIKLTIRNDQLFLLLKKDGMSFVCDIIDYPTEILGFDKCYEISMDKSFYKFDWIKDIELNKVKLIINKVL